MATFLKRGDKWQAQTCIRGRRKAKTFDTKAEARRWAVAQEAADKSGLSRICSSSGMKPKEKILNRHRSATPSSEREKILLP